MYRDEDITSAEYDINMIHARDAGTFELKGRWIEAAGKPASNPNQTSENKMPFVGTLEKEAGDVIGTSEKDAQQAMRSAAQLLPRLLW